MYIVIEIQTSALGTISTLTYQYDTTEAAEAKYHSILAAAATSALPVHAAVMLTNAGMLIKSEFYRHEAGEE